MKPLLDLSTEECKTHKKSTEETPADLDDIISEQEEATNAVSELEITIRNDLNKHERYEAAVDNMGKIVTSDKVEILPTSADIVVAQESLRCNARMLGIDVTDILSTLPSNESVEMVGLNYNLSTESMKEFILNLIEKLKMMFKEIVSNIKKMYVKTATLFNNNKTLANKLISGLENTELGKKSDDFTADDVKFLTGYLKGIMIVDINDTNVYDPVDTFISYLNVANDPYLARASTDIISKLTDIVSKSVTGNDFTFDNSLLVYNTVVNYFNSNIKKDNFYAKLGEVMESIDESLIKDKVNDHTVIILRADNNNIRTLTIRYDKKMYDEAKTKRDSVSILNSLVLSIDNFSIKSKFLDKITIKVPEKEALIKLLKAIVVDTVDSKLFYDITTSNIEQTNKLLDSITKNASDKYEISFPTELAIKKVTNFAKITSTQVAMELILGQLASSKIVLKYATKAAEYYKK